MSAADFLFTSKMQRVLGLAFADPVQSFTLNAVPWKKCRKHPAY